MTTLLLLLTNAIGGSSYPAATVVLRGFPERDAVFLRLAIASALFSPFAWRGRARLAALGARDWLLLSAVGLLGYALPLVLGLYGQHLSSGTSASLLACLEPVSLVALSCLFLGEPMTVLKGASLAAGLAGAVLIAFQGPPSWRAAAGDRWTGDLMLAAQGVFWSLYSVFGKPVLKRVEPMEFTAVTTMIAFAGAAPWAASGLSFSAWRAAGAGPWLALVYLAVAASFLGALIWNNVLSRVEASATANFIFLQPLVGVALGAGLLGDPLTRWTLAGGALIVAGMWAAARGGPVASEAI
ncbi:MAG: EamA family transporter [Elusimicrobia bacterium]|nr:EamA family transporter [Elusimicrobiota bacterium]